MQVSNTASSSTLTQPGPTGNAVADPPSASADQAAATSATSTAKSPSQDDAVNISPEGAASAARETGSTTSAHTDNNGDTGAPGKTESSTPSTTASTADDSGDASATSDSSALKSFTYGTLGLERPDQPQSDQNPFYTAGRWLAAGLTIGGIISLLACRHI